MVSIEESHAFVSQFKIAPLKKGPLSGLTFGVKDLIDIAGMPTGYGCKEWGETHPVPDTSALAVEQLLYAGAECRGKLVTSQLAYDLVGVNCATEPPMNPKAPDRFSGGSSSGPASAVAAGLVDFALASDTGGSIRVPSSYCGILGMRPTPGIISLAGVCPFSPSFDTLGPMARTVDVFLKVAAVLLSREIPKPSVPKLFLVKEAFQLADVEVRKALEEPLKKLKTEEVSLRLEEWLVTFTTLQRAEIWTTLGPWIQKAKPKLTQVAQGNFEYAKSVDRALVPEALKMRRVLFKKVYEMLSGGALLVFPTASTLPPLRSTGMKDRSDDFYTRLCSLTSLGGLIGCPQVSLPIAHVKGVPVGLSLLGAHGRDAELLSTVSALEHLIGSKA